MTANPFIPGDPVTVEVYRGTLEGVVMEVEGEWVIFDLLAKDVRAGASEYTIGHRLGVHYNQAKKSKRQVVRAHVDLLVDFDEWATEYGIPHTEVREDIKTYLTTALSEMHPLLKLKGSVQ